MREILFERNVFRTYKALSQDELHKSRKDTTFDRFHSSNGIEYLLHKPN